MNTLLHPEYFKKVPLVGNTLKKRFEQLEADATPSEHESSGITVALRTLNEVDRLEELLQDIRKQELNGEIEIVVVENESTDATVEVARKFGAKVLTLPRAEFTYPKSMNMAVEAASHELIFLTVGHAKFLSSLTLRAGVNAMHGESSTVGGAFGHALPNANASATENIIAMGSLYFTRQRRVEKSGLGTMAATGCLFRKSAWEAVGGFDEAYAAGGEDDHFAKKLLEHGYIIKDEPLLSTHHTHGLSFVNSLKQWAEWVRLGKPSGFDKARLQKRRPDLDLDG